MSGPLFDAGMPAVYPILDSAALEARGIRLTEAAAAVLEGGARILQVRHKGEWSRAFFERTLEVRNLCTSASARLVINDRADMAALIGASVHLGQDDLPPDRARELLTEGEWLGYSTHNEAQVRAALDLPVDYLALGPVFATSSKDNPDPEIGLAQFQSWRALAPKPVVAIGGITRANARSVWDAGADSVAIIADLMPGVCTWRALRERMEEWQQLTRM